MNQNVNIRLLGVSNKPAENDAEDGQLSLSINATYENGALHPIFGGEKVCHFPSNYRLMFVHSVSDTDMPDNYILWDAEAHVLAYFNRFDMSTGQAIDIAEIQRLDDNVNVLQVTSVKKILVINTTEGIRYARWTDKQYKWLGAFPEMPYMRPYLALPKDEHATGGIPITNIDDIGGLKTIGTYLTAAINAEHNNAKKESMFTYPFFCRMSLRLYDGSNIATEPYLLIPSLNAHPYLVYYETDSNQFVWCAAYSPRMQLRLHIGTFDLGEWEGVITSVDVFITPEMALPEDWYEDSKLFGTKISTVTAKPASGIIGLIHPEYFDTAHRFVSGRVSNSLIPFMNTSLKSLYSAWFRATENTWRISRYDLTNYTDKKYGISAKMPFSCKDRFIGQKVYFEVGEEPSLGNKVEDESIQLEDTKFVPYIITGEEFSDKEISLYLIDEEDDDMRVLTTVSGEGSLKYISISNPGLDKLIEERQTYFKIMSIRLEDICRDNTIICVKSEDRSGIINLEAMEKMEASSFMRYDITANKIVSYNDRIHAILNAKKPYGLPFAESIITAMEWEKSEGDDYEKVNRIAIQYMDGGSIKRSHIHKHTRSEIPFLNIKYLHVPYQQATKIIGEKEIKENIEYRKFVYHWLDQSGNEKDVRFYIEETDEAPSVSVDIGMEYSLPFTGTSILGGCYYFNNFKRAVPSTEGVKGKIKLTWPSDIRIKYDTSQPAYVMDVTHEDLERTLWETISHELFSRFHVKLPPFEDRQINESTVVDYGNGKANYEDSTSEDAQNMLYVSGWGNPFTFQNGMAEQVPASKIIDLATAAKPISTGQFGDYPLYLFTDEGLFAMGTNKDGTYDNIRPVSRDVMEESGHTLTLDGSVMFPTSRGIMEVSGGNLECITEELRGHNYTENVEQLNTLAERVAEIGFTPDVQTHIESFTDEAHMLYSYKRQMIFFFKDGKKLGYVFNLKSGTWGQFTNNLSYAIGGFSKAIAVSNQGGESYIYDMSKETSGCKDEGLDHTKVNSLILTRPFLLSGEETLKTINSIMLRGIFDNGEPVALGDGSYKMNGSKVMLVLYVSNDGINWDVLSTSDSDRLRNYTGTPFKYYRVAIVAKEWQEGDSISGMSVEYLTRLNNIMR